MKNMCFTKSSSAMHNAWLRKTQYYQPVELFSHEL